MRTNSDVIGYFLPKFVLAMSAMTLGMSSSEALELYVMRDAPNAQGTPGITQYSSITNFQANSGGLTSDRGIAQGSSCDFAIVNGVVYYIAGDASSTGDKTLFSWPSVADWAANTNTTSPGTRTGAAPMSGMAIYQGSLYVLEGNMTATESKTLKRWSSPSAWATGSAPDETFGARNVGDGIGFDIDENGVVYFLDTNGSPNSATSGILYSWPSISNFIANTSISTNVGPSTDLGGTFTFFSGSANEIAGLAIVPEPSTYAMAVLSGLTLAAAHRLRKKRNA
ncbi:hypothetical protein GC170_05825 [bacterium]|nr:hypothetical protein [bacterium]